MRGTKKRTGSRYHNQNSLKFDEYRYNAFIVPYVISREPIHSYACRKGSISYSFSALHPANLLEWHCFHERCWSLVEHVIGMPSIESDTKRFFYEVRSQWIISCSYAEWPFLDESGVWLSFLNQHRDPRKFHHQYEDSLDELRETMQARVHDCCRQYPARDPVNIPELRDVFEQAKRHRRYIQKSPELSTSFWQRRTPFDVQLLILGYLEGYDIKRALYAFCWSVPGSYWRHRFPKHVILEFPALLKENIDWKFLYFTVHKLMETSYGLQNRQRTIGILEEIKHRLAYTRRHQSVAPTRRRRLLPGATRR